MCTFSAIFDFDKGTNRYKTQDVVNTYLNAWTLAVISVFDLDFFVHRETLLGQLTVHVRQISEEFSQRTGHRGGKGVPKGKNLPEVVNNIVYVRQLEAKVRHMCLASWLAGWLVGWLVGFIDWLIDWLVDWLIEWVID